MKSQYLLLDVISSLPPNVIEMILTRLPMRDAFRTSILSRNWRHRCLSIPKLVFDDKLFKGSINNELSIKCKLLHVVYPILLLHNGTILEFSLCISQLRSCCQIDQIILHLSRNKTVENFSLCIGTGEDYKLPSSLFSLQRLAYLKLQNCAFKPPSTFYGFSRLTSLHFDNVSITAITLLHFISKCPLLKNITLIEDDRHFTGGESTDFVEPFEGLPLIEYLYMSCHPIKCFAAGDMPDKLPTLLVHLKILIFSGLSFVKEDELSSALFLITSSPKIEKIALQMCYDSREAMSQTAINFFELQDWSGFRLDHLQELEITNFTNLKPGLDFVKLILASSPMLKKVRIAINNRMSAVTASDEVHILRDMIRYPRASTKAEIIFEHSTSGQLLTI